MRRIFSPAFTLIEVLVVVVILSIVATFAYHTASRSAEKTRIRAAWSMLRAVDAAARAHNQDAGSWPDLNQLILDGYLEDPNAPFQTDWVYSTFPDPPAIPTQARAVRQAGSCAGKILSRFFVDAGGQAAGNETDSTPACP